MCHFSRRFNVQDVIEIVLSENGRRVLLFVRIAMFLGGMCNRLFCVLRLIATIASIGLLSILLEQRARFVIGGANLSVNIARVLGQRGMPTSNERYMEVRAA